jgi:CRISPR-associated endoribonuclease Cas6
VEDSTWIKAFKQTYSVQTLISISYAGEVDMPATSFTLICELPRPVELHSFSGEVARAVFLAMLDDVTPGLAQEFHETQYLAPYSVTPFLSPGGEVLSHYLPEGRVEFRVSMLSEKASEAVRRYAENGFGKVVIYGVQARIMGVRMRTFRRRSDMMPARFAVWFRTPTAFRSRLGKYVVCPDPYHLMKNLAKIYKKYEDPTIPYRRYREWVREGGIMLENQHVRGIHRVPDHHGWWRGFTGRAVYSMPEKVYDSRMAKLTAALLEYSEFTNVGKHRTAGYGFVSCRPLAMRKEGGRRRPLYKTNQYLSNYPKSLMI